jgi:sialidase-1
MIIPFLKPFPLLQALLWGRFIPNRSIIVSSKYKIMAKMNALKYLMPLLLVFIGIACGKSTPTSEKPPIDQDKSGNITVSDTLVKFSPEADSSNVEITINTTWKITSQKSWLIVSPSSGKGDAVVKISVEANNTFDQRETVLTVKAGGEEQDIHVIQKGVDTDTSQPIKIDQESSYLDLSGAAAIMEVDHNGAFDFPAGQSFSISLKVKMDKAPNDGRLISRRNGFQTGYGIFVHGDGRVGMNVRDDNNTNFGSNFGTTNVADGKWHHIVGIFDANEGKTYLYIDGHREGERVFPGNPVSIKGGGKLIFGALNTNLQFKADVLLDDVRFWKKALTKKEVYADAANITVNSDAADLIAGWDFEKGNEEKAPDVTGKFTGNLMNGAHLSNLPPPRNTEKGTLVFVSGKEGYQSFRIPAIIEAPNGNLLAFAEGRKNGSSDFGNVDIVVKRSKNGGESWSSLKVVVNNSDLQAGNSAPVVDMTDPKYPDGRIFLFYNTGNAPEQQVRKGNGERRVWYKTSTDNGKTWSNPTEITSQVKKDNWRTYANTPGHAMQFNYGKYKGRIYVAANHSKGPPQSHFEDYHSHGFYTDDHGKTFHISETISFKGSNEATAAELGGNRLMMNMRNQKGTPRTRIVAISNDGGARWDTTYYDSDLSDPVCEGSILNIGDKQNRNKLAFCNNNSTSGRKDLTLRISTDGGKTWPKQYLIDKPGVNTGYSDIVKMSNHKVGVLYERYNSSQIVFTVIKWKK